MPNYYKEPFKDEQLEILKNNNNESVLALDIVERTTGAVKLSDVVANVKNSVIVEGNWENAAVKNKMRADLLSIIKNTTQSMVRSATTSSYVTTGDENLEFFGVVDGYEIGLSSEDSLYLPLSSNVGIGSSTVKCAVTGEFLFEKNIPVPTRIMSGDASNSRNRYPDNYYEHRVWYDNYRKLIIWSYKFNHRYARVFQFINEDGIVESVNLSFLTMDSIKVSQINNHVIITGVMVDGYGAGWTMGVIVHVNPNGIITRFTKYTNGDWVPPSWGLLYVQSHVIDTVNNRILFLGTTDNNYTGANPNYQYYQIMSCPIPTSASQVISPTLLNTTNISKGNNIYEASFAKHPTSNYYVIGSIQRLYVSSNLTSWSACSTTGLTANKPCTHLDCRNISGTIVWSFLHNGSIFKYTGATISTSTAATKVTPTGLVSGALVMDLQHQNGKYLMCCNNGQIFHSPDLISFTEITGYENRYELTGITLSNDGNLYVAEKDPLKQNILKFSTIQSNSFKGKRFQLGEEMLIIDNISTSSGGTSTVTLQSPTTKTHQAGDVFQRTSGYFVEPGAINHTITLKLKNNFEHNACVMFVYTGNFPNAIITAEISVSKDSSNREVYTQMEKIQTLQKNNAIETEFYYFNESDVDEFTIQIRITNPYYTGINISSIFGFTANELQFE